MAIIFLMVVVLNVLKVVSLVRPQKPVRPATVATSNQAILVLPVLTSVLLAKASKNATNVKKTTQCEKIIDASTVCRVVSLASTLITAKNANLAGTIISTKPAANVLEIVPLVSRHQSTVHLAARGYFSKKTCAIYALRTVPPVQEPINVRPAKKATI